MKPYHKSIYILTHNMIIKKAISSCSVFMCSWYISTHIYKTTTKTAHSTLLYSYIICKLHSNMNVALLYMHTDFYVKHSYSYLGRVVYVFFSSWKIFNKKKKGGKYLKWHIKMRRSAYRNHHIWVLQWRRDTSDENDELSARVNAVVT